MEACMRRLTCNCHVKKNNEKTPAPLRQREMNIAHWQTQFFPHPYPCEQGLNPKIWYFQHEILLS